MSITKALLIISAVGVTLAISIKDSDDDVKKIDSRTVYDQRQTGKFNLHVNIKDVHLINLQDSISSIGDYGAYDYGDYESSEGTDGDYDISHLTVSPIFAFLGSKPTKPSTTTKATTEKVSEMATESQDSNKDEASTTAKQELETTVKQENVSTNSLTSTPATVKPVFSPIKVNESIDYEEIPVEVQYYRTNQSKLPHATSLIKQNNRHAVNVKRHRRPVQILDARTNNNVKIIESDDQERIVKICSQGEFRDANGRCRVKMNGRNRPRGL